MVEKVIDRWSMSWLTRGRSVDVEFVRSQRKLHTKTMSEPHFCSYTSYGEMAEECMGVLLPYFSITIALNKQTFLFPQNDNAV